jgi:hypothetical protein
MKCILTVLAITMSCVAMQAQSKKTITTIKEGKANDHFMLQFTGDTWAGKPDSIATKSIGRGANIYFMMNFPFKTNDHFSAALGAGFGTSSVYLDKVEAAIAGSTSTLYFTNTSATTHYKKYKVATAYLEAPIELRWVKNPKNVDKSFKIALGGKVGTLLSASTKGKTLLSSTGSSIGNYTQQLKSKSYFNSSRIALTARIGYGHFSVFGQYQMTTLFKENVAAAIRPYSIGFAISGL